MSLKADNLISAVDDYEAQRAGWTIPSGALYYGPGAPAGLPSLTPIDSVPSSENFYQCITLINADDWISSYTGYEFHEEIGGMLDNFASEEGRPIPYSLQNSYSFCAAQWVLNTNDSYSVESAMAKFDFINALPDQSAHFIAWATTVGSPCQTTAHVHYIRFGGCQLPIKTYTFKFR